MLRSFQENISKRKTYWDLIYKLHKYPILKKAFLPIITFEKPPYVTANGYKIYINKNDELISKALLMYKSWEKYLTKVFKQTLKPGNIVVDAGAHIGYFTMLSAKLVGPKGHVYAFEPNPTNYDLLKKSVKDNKYKNITLINAAVSDRNGKSKLYINKINTGKTSLLSSKSQDTVKVKVVTLDSYLKNKKVDFIKIDVEGTEAKTIKGGKNIIKNNKLKLIIELNPKALSRSKSNCAEFIKLLKKLGFKITYISEKKEKLEKVKNDICSVFKKENISEVNLICEK